MTHDYHDSLPMRRKPVGDPPPWNEEQVQNLNDWQAYPHFHPFTCPERSTPVHKRDPAARDHGMLVATRNGWECPACGYTQEWAHPSMTSGEWRQWPIPF